MANSIRELQRVVNGRKWWFLSRYTLQEQIAAIEALGRTRSHDALTFLTNLYRATVVTESQFSVILASGASGASTTVESRSEKHTYQAASGPLRAELDFAVARGDSFLPSWRADADIEADRRRFLDRDSHRIVRTAIAALKASLGVAE